MILSFSIADMLPKIEAGIAEALGGGGTDDAAVKMQTIRHRGPRAEQLLRHDPTGHSIPYDLDLWWKSRTPGRRKLGTIPSRLVRVFPIAILHGNIEPPDEPAYPCYRIDGPSGWRSGDAMLFWSPGDGLNNGFAQEALNDGFDGPESFARYFVPNMGDVFNGILFQWRPLGRGEA